MSGDGLRLVFQRARTAATYPGKETEFVISKRTARDKPWSEPQLLPMTAAAALTDALTWPHLSEDGLSLSFCHGGDRSPVVYLADRAAADQPFGNYRTVALNDEPARGRSPRYFPERGGIYLSADDPNNPGDSDLYVVFGLPKSPPAK